MKNTIIRFEEEIGSIYEYGKIRAPIHLRSGNEEQLIKIFKNIRDEDYVFSTWASHIHCLLKGVPEEDIKHAILEGRSITLNFPEYNLYSSAIVGGTPSIATGAAYALKKQNKSGRVYCFLGDMGFHTGIAYEAIKYSIGHNLPITFIVEDNEKSVATPTFNTWRVDTYNVYELMCKMAHGNKDVKIEYYKYESKYPHAGTGTFVEF
ncbi:MAG: thiamine pyrophosphate-dependent enzyme [Candidatus Hodarchaeales archaeon]|jgi:pyruvate dehydrogenase E1 component alpha subunit